MGGDQRRMFWIVVALAAAAVFLFEALYMPMGVLKLAVFAAALIVIGLAWFKLRRQKRGHEHD